MTPKKSITREDRLRISRKVDDALIKWFRRPKTWSKYCGAKTYTKHFSGWAEYVPLTLGDIMEYWIGRETERAGSDRYRVLFRVWTDRLEWESEEMAEAMRTASGDVDGEFFNAMIETRRAGTFQHSEEFTLEKFLLFGWDRAREIKIRNPPLSKVQKTISLYPLHQYSDSSLELLAEKIFGLTHSADSFKHQRRRLGLKSFKPGQYKPHFLRDGRLAAKAEAS